MVHTVAGRLFQWRLESALTALAEENALTTDAAEAEQRGRSIEEIERERSVADWGGRQSQRHMLRERTRELAEGPQSDRPRPAHGGMDEIRDEVPGDGVAALARPARPLERIGEQTAAALEALAREPDYGDDVAVEAAAAVVARVLHVRSPYMLAVIRPAVSEARTADRRGAGPSVVEALEAAFRRAGLETWASHVLARANKIVKSFTASAALTEGAAGGDSVVGEDA